MVVARAICADSNTAQWIQRAHFTTTRKNGHREYWVATVNIPSHAKVVWSHVDGQSVGIVTLPKSGKTSGKARYKTVMTIHDRLCLCCLRALYRMGRYVEIEFLINRGVTDAIRRQLW
jgi:hypothetical protein